MENLDNSKSTQVALKAAETTVDLNSTTPTVDQLADALQYAWDEFCTDTGCIPGCFTIHGPGTTQVSVDFTRGNFVRFAVDALAYSRSKDAQNTPQATDGVDEQLSIFTDDDAVPDDIIAGLNAKLTASEAEVLRLQGVNRSWIHEAESLKTTMYAMREEVDKWRDKYLNEVGVRAAAERSRDDAISALVRSERGKTMLPTIAVLGSEGPEVFQGAGPDGADTQAPSMKE